MAKRYEKDFKIKALRYYIEHREEGVTACARTLGISANSLTRWLDACYESDDADFARIAKAFDAVTQKDLSETRLLLADLKRGLFARKGKK